MDLGWYQRFVIAFLLVAKKILIRYSSQEEKSSGIFPNSKKEQVFGISKHMMVSTVHGGTANILEF